jgi:hypothetical protein
MAEIAREVAQQPTELAAKLRGDGEPFHQLSRVEFSDAICRCLINELADQVGLHVCRREPSTIPSRAKINPSMLPQNVIAKL